MFSATATKYLVIPLLLPIAGLMPNSFHLSYILIDHCQNHFFSAKIHTIIKPATHSKAKQNKFAIGNDNCSPFFIVRTFSIAAFSYKKIKERNLSEMMECHMYVFCYRNAFKPHFHRLLFCASRRHFVSFTPSAHVAHDSHSSLCVPLAPYPTASKFHEQSGWKRQCSGMTYCNTSPVPPKRLLGIIDHFWKGTKCFLSFLFLVFFSPFVFMITPSKLFYKNLLLCANFARTVRIVG